MSYGPYPQYKNLDVEWLSEVPAHWCETRLKNVTNTHRFSLSPSYFGELEVFHYSIPLVQSTGTGAIEPGEEIDSNKLVIKEEQVLLSKLNPRKSTVVIAKPYAELLTLASTEFVPVLAVPGKTQLHFLEYLINSEEIRQCLDSQVTSVTRSHQRVSPEEIFKIKLAIPSTDEQIQITRYLDYETDKIDELIAEQEKLIDLLKEKRQATISHAVTKGLNPDAVPMKDSGVEWLGEVPKHWKSGRLKHLITIRGGQDHKAVESKEPTAIPVIGSGGQFSYANQHLYEGESVLLGRKGTIDKPLYITGKFWTVDTMFYSEIHECANGKFVHYAATNIPFDLYSTNTALPSMSQFDLSNHAAVFPDKKEQTEIVKYLDRETAKLDTLLSEAQRGIELLKERRSALISAAVTGKIDVRNWEPQGDAA